MTWRGRGRGDQRGQAAVELVLVVPFVVVLALLLLQVALVVRDQVLVVHAAREAVRQAAVDAGAGSARRAAADGSGLIGDRLEVDVGPRGAPGTGVRVTVRYRAPTIVPVVGAMVGDVDLQASATMRIEGPRGP